MGKKKDEIDLNEAAMQSCTTCSEWKNEDPIEYPCFLAKVVVVRANPRLNCKYWRVAR